MSMLFVSSVPAFIEAVEMGCGDQDDARSFLSNKYLNTQQIYSILAAGCQFEAHT